MFRFFELLVDPYAAYRRDRHAARPAVAVPARLPARRPARSWPGPSLSVLAVALIEIWLIWYVGRMVDVLGDTPPAEVWARHGLELALVAAFILLARPADPDRQRRASSTSR